MTTARDTPTRLGTSSLFPPMLAGMAFAIIGLVPWLVTDMHLPLQNLWAVEVSPDQMPITVLPFSQYYLGLLAAMIVVGAALAGCFARATRARHSRFGVTAIAVGVTGVQAIATIHTAVIVSKGLRPTAVARAYLTALTAGTVVAVLIGLIVLVLIARAPVPGAVIGLSIAGIAAGSWLIGIVVPTGSFATESVWVLLDVVRAVPAVIVGLAVVWSGIGTFGRAAAAIGSLVLLWIGPAAVTAISAAAGTRVLAPHPDEMVEFAVQMFGIALGPEGGAVYLLVVAVIVIVLGLAARWSIRRWHR
jgi:hypothetical protein